MEISEAAIAFVFPVVFPPSLDIFGWHDPPLSFAGRPTVVFFSAQCQAMAHATILFENCPSRPRQIVWYSPPGLPECIVRGWSAESSGLFFSILVGCLFNNCRFCIHHGPSKC